MKKLFILLIAFVFCNCKKQTEDFSLNFIDNKNKLMLSFEDEEFGEWGGNEKEIIIYRDSLDGDILCDFIEKDMISKNLSVPKMESFKRKIKITDEHINLLIESIQELSIQKINSKEIISNSGLYSRVQTSDKSLIIDVYPSSKWRSFEILCEKLKK